MTEISPEYTAYKKGYKDGKASANAKIESLIREIHDLVFEQGKELGRADALKPTPIEDYDWSSTDEYVLLAFDDYGQAFFPFGMIKLNDFVYDAKGFKFNVQEFLKGEEIEYSFGRKGRVLPRKIKWFIKLPTPRQIEGAETGQGTGHRL